MWGCGVPARGDSSIYTPPRHGDGEVRGRALALDMLVEPDAGASIGQQLASVALAGQQHKCSEKLNERDRCFVRLAALCRVCYRRVARSRIRC
jgi:hypothetical protein